MLKDVRQRMGQAPRVIQAWVVIVLLTSCQVVMADAPLTPQQQSVELILPTVADVVAIPTASSTAVPPPATWTPAPTVAQIAGLSEAAVRATSTPRPLTATSMPFPSRTPVTPTLTPTLTATPTETSTPTPRMFMQYGELEALPIGSYPRPPNDNGWGIHWMPTVSQERATVDRFVAEVKRMNIKWVVFLNNHTNIGDNDYLVDQLVANDIMPVMRLYRDSVLPYDGELGQMVRYYRQRGVFYYQLYNEPNVNIENNQGAANPNAYAVTWSAAARDVIKAGGLPGLGALSPGGEYNHLQFLERTIRAIKFNGDTHLLNRAWISLHNYHGLRALDDPGGFMMFREYNKIAENELGRSLPIITTEGGSYHENPQVVTDLLRAQYSYMRDAEPYYFAFSHWLLANRAGGGGDGTWEWQALIQPGYVHPVVTDFFYQNRE